jgi:NhaC family Na+:H+ antiporter
MEVFRLSQVETSARKPSLVVALLPLLFMVGAIYLFIVVWGQDAHFALLCGAIFAALIGKALGAKWKEIERTMLDCVAAGLQAIVILMIIGALIGTWIAGGIVQSIIYYGLMVLSPGIFLFAVAVVCSITSLATGSSWTTAGTMGVACLGIGAGLGFPAAMTAGAVVSGAYFGDKMSPLSDTTNLAPAMTGANLFDHIRHMSLTTGPALVIALVLYLVLGLFHSAQGGADMGAVKEIMDVLAGSAKVNILLLLPPVLVILMVVYRVPAIPGLIGGVVLGMLCALYQGVGLAACFDAAQYGFVSETGNEVIDSLLSRGGLQSMLWSISLVLIALCLGGAMEASRSLEVVIETLLKAIRGIGGLVLSVLISCVISNIVLGDQYLSLVVPGRMFKPAFDGIGLEPKNLSRCLEDAGTVTSSLVPWNTCGAFMWATLGVSPLAYAPYAFLNLITPVISAIYGFTGWTIHFKSPELKEAYKNRDKSKKLVDFIAAE